MGKLIQLKIKPKKDNRVDDFLDELDCLKALFLQGDLDDILIIAHGKELKECTSSGLTVGRGQEMCRDFIKNAKDYVDD